MRDDAAQPEIAEAGGRTTSSGRATERGVPDVVRGGRPDDPSARPGVVSDVRGDDDPEVLRRRLAQVEAELRATVTQLDLANRELAAVATELEAAAHQLVAVEEETEVIDQEMRVRTEQVALGHDILERLLDELDTPVLILDGDRRVQVWSRGAVEWWGVDRDRGYAVPLTRLRGPLPAAAVEDLAGRAAAARGRRQEVVIDLTDRAPGPRSWQVVARAVDSTAAPGVDAIIIVGRPPDRGDGT